MYISGKTLIFGKNLKEIIMTESECGDNINYIIDIRNVENLETLYCQFVSNTELKEEMLLTNDKYKVEFWSNEETEWGVYGWDYYSLDSEYYYISDVLVEETLELETILYGFELTNNKITVKDFEEGKYIREGIEYKIYDTSGNEIAEQSKGLGTGTKIVIKDGNQVKEYTVVVYGDTSGDGEITSFDALTLIKAINKKIELADEVYFEAGRVKSEKGQTPSAIDALAIVKHLNKKYEITQSTSQSLITAKNLVAEDYGGYVTNYESINETDNGADIDWMIYHTDGENIYLIADECIDDTYAPDIDWLNTYVNGTADIDRKLANKLLSLYTTGGYSSSSVDGRMVAYMMDISVWSNFQDKTGYADYAMGAPTVELLVDSMNVFLRDDTAFSVKVTHTIGGNGYVATDLWSADEFDGIQGCSNSHSLYTESSRDYYLASPSVLGHAVLGVSCSGEWYPYGPNSAGYRPVVQLKSTVQLEKQADGTYIIVK